MSGHLPDSYGRLAPYAHRHASGAVVYEQGAALDRFFVVLRGRVDFEVVSESGDTEVVAEAYPGDLAGHVAAFTGRPTSATARTFGESVILAVPMDRAIDVFREAPELAMLLVRSFAEPDRPRQVPAEVELPPTPAVDGNVLRVQGEVNEAFFFLDSVVCPVDGTHFEFVRVRTRAVRPAARDSDFHVRYTSVDPTHYSVVVCPTCGYAAYLDDFDAVDEETRGRLWADREARRPLLGHQLTGARTTADAITVLDLAIRCYEMRGGGPSREAVLFHRRAWVEREAGNRVAEAEWLRRARESYRGAFEQDTRLTDDSALRAAYLVGDISLRLDEPHEGAPWLETVIRRADSKTQSGLIRMARDRLHDARIQLRGGDRAAS